MLICTFRKVSKIILLIFLFFSISKSTKKRQNMFIITNVRFIYFSAILGSYRVILTSSSTIFWLVPYLYLAFLGTYLGFSNCLQIFSVMALTDSFKFITICEGRLSTIYTSNLHIVMARSVTKPSRDVP